MFFRKDFFAQDFLISDNQSFDTLFFNISPPIQPKFTKNLTQA